MIQTRTWFSSPALKLAASITALLAVSSFLFYWVELRPAGNYNFFTAVWWVIVTVTTVGYGDIVPQTFAGRLIGMVVMASGIGLVSTLTGGLASYIIDRQSRRREGKLKVNQSNHFIIVGWNSCCFELIRSIYADPNHTGLPLTIVAELNKSERDNISEALDSHPNLQFVVGSPENETVLRKASFERSRTAFIVADDNLSEEDSDQKNIFIALTLNSLFRDITVIAEVMRPASRAHMQRTGVKQVIVRGEVSSRVLGIAAKHPALGGFLTSISGKNKGAMSLRALKSNEKKLTWNKIVLESMSKDGSLPIGLIMSEKNISLDEILDQESGLDQFIMELFESSGINQKLGQEASVLKFNPHPQENVALYDFILFLQPESAL